MKPRGKAARQKRWSYNIRGDTGIENSVSLNVFGFKHWSLWKPCACISMDLVWTFSKNLLGIYTWFRFYRWHIPALGLSMSLSLPISTAPPIRRSSKWVISLTTGLQLLPPWWFQTSLVVSNCYIHPNKSDDAASNLHTFGMAWTWLKQGRHHGNHHGNHQSIAKRHDQVKESSKQSSQTKATAAAGGQNER